MIAKTKFWSQNCSWYAVELLSRIQFIDSLLILKLLLFWKYFQEIYTHKGNICLYKVKGIIIIIWFWLYLISMQSDTESFEDAIRLGGL